MGMGIKDGRTPRSGGSEDDRGGGSYGIDLDMVEP